MLKSDEPFTRPMTQGMRLNHIFFAAPTRAHDY
jgi:hypothetical protein